MKRRLILGLAAAVACSVLVSGASAAASHETGHGQVFSFSGELLVAPGANAGTLSVQVETGNAPALHAMINAAQDQVFAIGSSTEVLVYARGVPHVGSSADLQAGAWLTVRIAAPFFSSLRQIENTTAATVSDTARPHLGLPLWLYSGTVAGAGSGGRLALHVGSGNWKALQSMLGQSLDQTFSYDSGTIFLLWQGRVPTLIDASQLKPGDQVTIRIRAPRSDSLAQVEATPAAHVGDHEAPPPPED